MLHVIVWRWGDKYGSEYTSRLARGVRHHLHRSHTFSICSPPVEDQYLTTVPGCFCRLRMFDPVWQRGVLRAQDGDFIACMDLDSIVTGQLDPIFDRVDRFSILQGANSINPCPYNGSLMMLRVGHYEEVWETFSLEAAQKIKYHEFPDDQGWIWHKIPDAGGWRVGAFSGVYAFKKPGWPTGDDLPSDARLVVFPGWRDPARFVHLSWIRNHWVGEQEGVTC